MISDSLEKRPIQFGLKSAIEALQRGGAVIIVDSERELEADLAIAASACSAEWVNVFLREARGILCLTLSHQRAAELGIERLTSNGADPFGTPFGYPVSVLDGTTSVSAQARARTIMRVGDATRSDFRLVIPGHVSTLIAHPAGLAGRFGHTEALVDLLSLAGLAPAGVLCEILDIDGEMAGASHIRELSKRLGLPTIDISEVRSAVEGGKGQ